MLDGGEVPEEVWLSCDQSVWLAIGHLYDGHYRSTRWAMRRQNLLRHRHCRGMEFPNRRHELGPALVAFVLERKAKNLNG